MIINTKPVSSSSYFPSCFFITVIPMAASEHSSTDEVLENLQEETSKESKPEFSSDEESLIIRMYNLVGERWALIAGRIPGRTAEEIEKYWTATYSTSD